MEREEAIRIALLGDEATSAERDALECFFRKHPDARDEWKALCAARDVWTRVPVAEPSACVRAGVLAGAARRRARKRLLHALMPAVSIAATLFLAVTLVLRYDHDGRGTSRPFAPENARAVAGLSGAELDGLIFGDGDFGFIDSGFDLLVTERALRQAAATPVEAESSFDPVAVVDSALEDLNEWFAVTVAENGY